jgi:HxlR-like helix-turn-helix
MSGKVFTQQLRALERDGLIGRTQALKAATCVEHSITWRGDASINPLYLVTPVTAVMGGALTHEPMSAIKPGGFALAATGVHVGTRR